LMVPMVVIGFYPKLATQTYDVKTTQVIAELQDTIAVVAQQRSNSSQLASLPFQSPNLSSLKASATLGMID
jgi:NAD(P)H-quinone oxidoreductase subunit 4